MPNKAQSVIKLSKQAYSLLSKKQYRQAEKVFLEAYDYDNGNSFILVGLGHVYRELNDFQKAIHFYQLILDIEPDNAFAMKGIGHAYRGMRDYEQTVSYWQQYLAKNGRDYHMMVRCADALKKLERLDEAEACYLRALEFDPKDKYGNLGLGSLYYKTGNEAGALKCLEYFVEHDDTNVAVLTMIGNIRQRHKEFDQAIAIFSRVIDLEMDNGYALYGLGNCYRGLCQYEDAVIWWLKVLEAEPDNQGLHSRLGDALVHINDLDRAQKHYLRSLDLAFDPFALIGLSKIYSQRGDYDEALACCERVLERQPGHNRTLEQMAEVYEACGDTDHAVQLRSRIG